MRVERKQKKGVVRGATRAPYVSAQATLVTTFLSHCFPTAFSSLDLIIGKNHERGTQEQGTLQRTLQQQRTVAHLADIVIWDVAVDTDQGSPTFLPDS